MNRIKAANKIPMLVLASGLFFFSCGRGPYDEVLDLNSAETPCEFFDQSLVLPDSEFEARMTSFVIPYINSVRTEGFLAAKSGNSIHYDFFTAPESKGTVVIFHGFCEFASKLNEVTYYFLRSGYSVCRFDHAGHGKSSRLFELKVPQDVAKVHVDDFATYVSDANDVIKKIAVPLSDGKPLFLFAHSMGGCVGALYIEQHPNVFARAVLTCPMLKVNCGIYPEWLTSLVCYVKISRRLGTQLVVGSELLEQQFKFDKKLKGFPKAERSASEARLKFQFDARWADIAYRTNAATYGWTSAALKAAEKAVAPENVGRIQIPVLVFQAENDVWVLPKGQIKFKKIADSLEKDVTLVYCPGAEHEIYNSRSPMLPGYYSRVLQFFGE